jgi:hypothetical protein
LWEEDDAEDGRPTIVSERPAAPSPSGRATKASEKTIPFGTSPIDRKTPEVQRSSLVQRLIEQGAIEDDGARNSEEALRDSEIDLLKLPDGDDSTLNEPELELVTPAAAPAPVAAAPTPRNAQSAIAPAETAAAGTPRRPGLFESVESEPASEDQVPTVSVKRPLPPVALELRNTGAALPVAAPRALSVASEREGRPLPAADRDITERISVPGGMVGSIAPSSRTFRPAAARERKGLPFWQTALAALVLLGGGISIAKFQAEHRGQTAALSAQSAPERGAALGEAEPPRAVATIANPAPTAALAAVEAHGSTPERDDESSGAVTVPAPAGPPPARATPRPGPAAPAQPAEQPLTPSVPAPSDMGPLLPKRDETVPVSRTRRVREQRAIASAEPEAAESAVEAPAPAPAPPKAAGTGNEPLPAHPSREQVVASLNAVAGELQRCVGDRHGVAEVTLTVRPAGFVSYAVVSGTYAGTSEGSCIARAVRAAKFPAFSDPTLRVTYPFEL